MNSLEAKEYLEQQKEIFKKTMAPEMKLATDAAISALEKQVPRIAIEKENNLGDIMLSCPNCLSPVTNYLNMFNHPSHCQFCGQALDWNGEK
jgi:hypothetical protein